MIYNLSMSKKKSYIIFAIVIVLGIVVDLVSKVLFANYFEAGGKDITVIPNFFYFTYVKNTGAAFGIFGDSTMALTIVSIIFVALFVLYDIFYHSNNMWYVLGWSMLVSGAIGNFVDRIFLGYVRDFVSIELFSFVFNIADVLITFGVICFGVYLLFYGFRDDKEKKKNTDTEKQEDTPKKEVNSLENKVEVVEEKTESGETVETPEKGDNT